MGIPEVKEIGKKYLKSKLIKILGMGIKNLQYFPKSIVFGFTSNQQYSIK